MQSRSERMARGRGTLPPYQVEACVVWVWQESWTCQPLRPWASLVGVVSVDCWFGGGFFAAAVTCWGERVSAV